MLLSADVAQKGGFENPLTRVEEEAKALDRLTPVLGAKRRGGVACR